jgi:hypothetical protein
MNSLLDRIDRALFDHSFTVFGLLVHVFPSRCAMHGAINVRTKRWGWVCFHPPLRSFGAWWPGYFYCSPDGTPGMSTFYLGRGQFCDDEGRAAERRRLYGHNFNTRPLYEARGVVYSDE